MMATQRDIDQAAREIFRFMVATLLVTIGLGVGLTCIGLYMLAQALAGAVA